MTARKPAWHEEWERARSGQTTKRNEWRGEAVSAETKKKASEMDAGEVLREIDEIVCLGDLIYEVRDSAAAGEWSRWHGSSWEHPKVKRYGELVARVAELVKP